MSDCKFGRREASDIEYKTTATFNRVDTLATKVNNMEYDIGVIKRDGTKDGTVMLVWLAVVFSFVAMLASIGSNNAIVELVKHQSDVHTHLHHLEEYRAREVGEVIEYHADIDSPHDHHKVEAE